VGARMRRAREFAVPGEVLIALAQSAGQTVASAAITDLWESVRGRFARLLGRGDTRKTEVADRWLAQTREQLVAAGPGAVEQAKKAAAERWASRFCDWLDEDPSLTDGLRALADDVAAQLPAGAVSPTGHSIAAGRDVNITAPGGGTAAGVIHGNVNPPNPPNPPNPTVPGQAKP
jgi:hypothetical protein